MLNKKIGNDCSAKGRFSNRTDKKCRIFLHNDIFEANKDYGAIKNNLQYKIM